VKAVIFVGPSLDLDTARAILPGAVFMPPAAQADVIGAVGMHQPHVIGLIDGSFGQTRSVWHKEILFALEQGIAVLGASSMGALRAAELDVFGMQGVGEVYRLFCTGVLEDDDEVAVVHQPREQGFRPITEPMVNIRATLARASEQQAFGASECEAVLIAAKRLHFSRRTLHTILAATRLPDSTCERVAEVFRTAYVDLKRADACELLERIRDREYTRPGPVHTARSRGFQLLYEQDRHARRGVSLRDVATYAALNLEDFDAVNFAALNRGLVLAMADLLHLEVTDAEVQAEWERFRRERDLPGHADVTAWRSAHDLTETELDGLVRERALCRRLHRWLLEARGNDTQTGLLLNELRLQGRYVETIAAASREYAEEDSASMAYQSISGLSEADLMELVHAHQRDSSWRVHGSISEWARESGFRDLQDLAYELQRARRVRRSRLEA
jgi:hypothetical protein